MGPLPCVHLRICQCDNDFDFLAAHPHMLLQAALLRKLLSTGFTLKTSTVLLLNVLVQLLLLLEPALAMVALEEVHLVLLVLVHVEQHGLSSGVGLPTSEEI